MSVSVANASNSVSPNLLMNDNPMSSANADCARSSGEGLQWGASSLMRPANTCNRSDLMRLPIALRLSVVPAATEMVRAME